MGSVTRRQGSCTYNFRRWSGYCKDQPTEFFAKVSILIHGTSRMGSESETGAPQWYRTVKNENGEEVREIPRNMHRQIRLRWVHNTPKFFGGFTTLTCQQFDANMVFGYSVVERYTTTHAEYDSDGAYSDRNQMRLMPSWKRWEKPGDIATHPVAL